MTVEIRTKTQLSDAMATEFAWRKRELINIQTLVSSNDRAHLKTVFVRAGIALLYAHWEGFVKQIGTYYLEFIHQQRLKNRELPNHFLGLAIGTIIRDAAESRKIKQCLDVVAFFREAMDSRARFKLDRVIDTESNLSSSVFGEIVKTLGLDYTRFETKEKLIDEKLLKNRNDIAHGEAVEMEPLDFLDLHGEIFAMMQEFYNQIENCVVAER